MYNRYGVAHIYHMVLYSVPHVVLLSLSSFFFAVVALRCGVLRTAVVAAHQLLAALVVVSVS